MELPDNIDELTEAYVRSHFDLERERSAGETEEQTVRRLLANLRWQAARRDRPPKFATDDYGVKHL